MRRPHRFIASFGESNDLSAFFLGTGSTPSQGKPKVTLFGTTPAPFGSTSLSSSCSGRKWKRCQDQRTDALSVVLRAEKGGRGNCQFLIIGLSIIDNRNYQIWSIQRLLSNLKSVAFLPKPCRIWRHFEGPWKAVIFSDNGKSKSSNSAALIERYSEPSGDSLKFKDNFRVFALYVQLTRHVLHTGIPWFPPDSTKRDARFNKMFTTAKPQEVMFFG